MVGKGSTDYQKEVCVWRENRLAWWWRLLTDPPVSLMMKTTGIPAPTVTWFFNGRMTTPLNLGKMDHWCSCLRSWSMSALTPSLSATGKAVWKGYTKLVVHTEDEECASVPRVETNPVTIGRILENMCPPFMLTATVHFWTISGNIDTAFPYSICVLYGKALNTVFQFRLCPLRKVIR